MTRFFVRHPVSTWMIFTAFVVLGIYAMPRLKIEAIPEVSLPKLTVVTSWNGASPKAIQRSITLPIESAARQLHGVESITSRSRSGSSIVEVEFRRDVDIDFARMDLNEQLGSVRRDLPNGSGQPRIQAFIPDELQTEDFFTFGVGADISTNELRERAETWILPQVLAIEGVSEARILGGANSLLKVMLDRRLLDLYGITADEIFASLAALDDLSGAGMVRQSGLEALVSVRDPLKIRSLENAVVGRSGGRNFRLIDLGEIKPDFEDVQYYVRVNGKNIVQISVEKRSGANTVTVSRALRKALPEITASIPFEVDYQVNSDQGQDLQDKLVELVYRSGAILGLLFLLLVLSLREVRLTAIVISSILFAIVISLSLFYFFDVSVNFITISGLTVCFGLILDNSILVLDSIHRRIENWKHAEEKDLSRSAKLKIAMETVIQGTSEVAFPIIATTLTTVVAFASFIFLSGRLSLYYVPLAITVATAMVSSLFVAFGWLPVVLNQRWAKSVADKTPDGDREIEGDVQLQKIVDTRIDLTQPPRGIERFFYGLQRTWWLAVPLLLVLIAYSFNVYDKKIIKGGFFQMPSQEELIMFIRLPDGTDIDVTSETVRAFEEQLEPFPEGVKANLQTFGNSAFLRIEFEEELLSTHYPMYYRELLTEQADKTGGSRIFIRGFSDQPYMKGSFRGSNLNSVIEFTGYNSKRLIQIAEAAERQVGRNRRARNAVVTTETGFGRSSSEEAIVEIHRDRLAERNLSLGEVLGHMRRLLGVDTPWRMMIDGDQSQVQLIYEDAESIQFNDLAAQVIESRNGTKVQLGELITWGMEASPGDITRENQKYSVNLAWEYVGTDRMRSAYLKNILAGIELPYGFSAEESERQFFSRDEEEDLSLMVILAAVFIFIVLAALFESLSLPVLVMSSVPMALVGVFLLFWWTSTSFDSSARIGLVLLFGIVVNNAILLASRYRHEAAAILKERLGGDPEAELSLMPKFRKQVGGSDLARAGKEARLDLLRRAVARGTHIRMRSILLTSGTTIIGLLPLLLFQDDGEGQDIWVNLAMASIGGLSSSLILILLCVPILYTLSVRIGWDRRLMTGYRGGLATALFVCLVDYLGRTTSLFEGPWLSNVHLALVGLGLLLTLIHLRRHSPDGVRYWDGLALGAAFGVILAITYQLYRIIFEKFADSELLELLAERGKNFVETIAAKEILAKVPGTESLLLFALVLALAILFSVFTRKAGPVDAPPVEPEAEPAS